MESKFFIFYKYEGIANGIRQTFVRPIGNDSNLDCAKQLCKEYCGDNSIMLNQCYIAEYTDMGWRDSSKSIPTKIAEWSIV